MSDTEVQQLIIYVGTQAKIDAARASGIIGPDDFAVVTNAPELQTKLTSANAGTGISITEVGGVVKISNTQTSAEWGNIQGAIQTQTDLWNYLSEIGVLASLSTTVKTDLVNAINEVYGIASTALQPSDIVDSTSSTATNKPLSANMGKSLQDQVDNLSARGRFLALWNCATGLAQSNPPESPYTYKTGDYFIIGTVAGAGGTNYKPNGPTYTTGVASTTVETNEVSVDDVYYYDGTNWRLQSNAQKTLSFANIAGDPYDNTSLASALNDKQDELVQGTGISIDTDTNTISNSGVRGVSTGTTNGTISVNTNGTSAEVAVAGLGSAAYTPSSDYATSGQGSKADTAIQGVTLNGSAITPDTNKTIVLDNIATTNTAQDITAIKTFKEQQKFQSGSANGCIVIGADAQATTLTANTRKLGRMSFHTKASTTLNCSFVSTDTQRGGDATSDVNLVEFGSRPQDATTTAPDEITFTVAKVHNSVQQNDKLTVCQFDKDGVHFYAQPDYNGTNVALVNQIPTVNNAVLTIQMNGVDIETFSANSSTNKTANIIASKPTVFVDWND